MTTNNEDDFSHMDERVNQAGNAAFGPRQRTPSQYDRPPVSLNNDVNRVGRAVPDGRGGFTTTQSGVARSSYAETVRDQSGVFTEMRSAHGSNIPMTALDQDSVVRIASNGMELKLGQAVALAIRGSVFNSDHAWRRPS